MARHLRLLTAALALVFLGAHIQSLPRSLEDIDTINLALGVESFDVVEHRPHPPGYPVFIAMGKLSTALVSVVMSGADRNERAAVGLAVWGVLAGAVGVWVLVGFWRATGWSPGAAWFAAALAVVSPLFWFTSARPLTDATALVAAMAVQWAIVRHGVSGTGPRPRSRPLLVTAFFAGVLIGLRTQTLWLTAPLLTWAVVRDLRGGQPRQAASVVLAAAVGCLIWAVPLVVNSGGLGAYLTALATQGAEDFSGVDMVATSVDGRLLADAITATMIAPWRTAWLGEVMSGLAVIGLARLLWSQRPVLVLVVIAFVPYLAFHLTFQETETVRYALPLVVPVAGLAVHALFWLPTRVAATIATLLMVASLVTAQQSLSAYGRNVPPTFQVFRDAEVAADGMPSEPLVVAHTGMRRVADWYRTEWPTLPVIAASDPSWLRIVDHFRSGATSPAWFLTDRRRNDVVLFDPRSRTVVRDYPQDPEVRRLVGQARQDEVRWWEIAAPAWMLGRGWALSPDVSGVTFASRRDPHRVPADAYLRRSREAHRLMIGGRYLTGTGDAAIVVEIEGRPVSRWVVAPQQPHFLYWVDLPAGVLMGDGAYATMHVRVEAAAGAGDPARLGLEQFDFAATGDVMAGFADGWQEPELEADTGRSWRWSESRATLVTYPGSGPARLTLAGESPLRYFDRPSNIVVSVEGREVSRFVASSDFVEVIELPAEVFTVTPSRVTIESDQAFVPAERGEGADLRQLAVRFFRAELDAR